MARLTFLWHLHQPQYRTADGRVHAPWVLLHSAGEYFTLAHLLARTDWPGHVLNLTPVFLDQLVAYRDGTAHDPLLEALATPSGQIAPEQVAELLRWAFLLHPRQFDRWPRLAELAERTTGASPADLARRYTRQDLTDLQVLVVLAYAAPNLAWEPELARLAARSSSWSDGDRRLATEWLAACPGRLLDAYQGLARRSGVEIATSPWGHPIMPLLIDTGIVTESWAPHPAPPAPVFAAPEDAEEHLRQGLATMAELGFAPQGCWPPEGSVSRDAVLLYGRHGVKWLCTDEGILAASLGRHVSGETGFGHELFRPWRLAEGGPALFFRHRGLSDFIGFQASRFPDEADAARSLADSLRGVANRLPADAGIVLALDGENPWTAFPQGGARFLAVLADELRPSSVLQGVTLAERAASETPETLPRLHPGSWIGGVFGTWIGHPEKNRGWEVLKLARALGAQRGGRSWLAAEGSDWWWWLGDDNPTLLAPLYDTLFRAHVHDACEAAGVVPPAELAAPVRSSAVPLRVPLSRTWPRPALDGRATSYFEWSVATWVEAPPTHRRLARIALRADGQTLWLRAEPRPGAPPLAPLVVTLVSEHDRHSWALPDDLPERCAVRSALEVGLPLPVGPVLLAIEHNHERLPLDGFYRLDPVEVDEP